MFKQVPGNLAHRSARTKSSVALLAAAFVMFTISLCLLAAYMLGLGQDNNKTESAQSKDDVSQPDPGEPSDGHKPKTRPEPEPLENEYPEDSYIKNPNDDAETEQLRRAVKDSKIQSIVKNRVTHRLFESSNNLELQDYTSYLKDLYEYWPGEELKSELNFVQSGAENWTYYLFSNDTLLQKLNSAGEEVTCRIRLQAYSRPSGQCVSQVSFSMNDEIDDAFCNTVLTQLTLMFPDSKAAIFDAWNETSIERLATESSQDFQSSPPDWSVLSTHHASSIPDVDGELFFVHQLTSENSPDSETSPRVVSHWWIHFVPPSGSFESLAPATTQTSDE